MTMKNVAVVNSTADETPNTNLHQPANYFYLLNIFFITKIFTILKYN